MVKNPPSKAREAIHTVSIPGSGRSLRGGHGNHSCVLAGRIPWSEEPGGLQSVGLQRVRYDGHIQHIRGPVHLFTKAVPFFPLEL